MALSITQLKTLSKLEEIGNYTQVGIALDLSPAAVTKHIRSIEEELGQPIVYSSTRKITLTTLGKELLDLARRTLDSYDQMNRWAYSQVAGSPKGNISILLHDINVFNLTLKPWLSDFRSLYPGIMLSIDVMDPDVNLEELQADIYWGIGGYLARRFPNVSSTHLTNITYGIFASPVYLKKFGEPQEIGDLKGHYLVSNLNHRPKNTLFYHDPSKPESVGLAKMNVSIETKFGTEDLAAEGMGIVNASPSIAATDKYIKSGRLLPILRNHWVESLDLGIYYDPIVTELPHIKLFLEFFQSKKSKWAIS